MSAPIPGLDAVWDPERDDRLTCVAVYAETHDVRTFVFEAPERRRFVYEAGQFLTFGFEIGGETVYRCYSLASSPLRPHTASITVKRVPGGPVSGWLHDNLRPGMSIQAVGPMGSFTAVRHPARRYLFASGGSGITPLMSMSRALADRAAPIDVVFLHAGRTPADLVFRAELALMARRLTGFRVLFLPEDRAGEADWPGPTGRLSTDLLEALVPDVAERTVLCCGPAPFMRAVEKSCGDLGVPAANFHHESFDFSTLQAEEPAVAAAVEHAEQKAEEIRTYTVDFAKSKRTLAIKADEFVLRAARAAGLRLPASCTTGLCGTCKSKLLSGRVDMKHQGGIRQREVDSGLFLPCCSKPLSDLVIER